MRTDSVRLSDEFIKDTYGYIKDNYGSEYVGYVKRVIKLRMFKMHMKP